MGKKPIVSVTYENERISIKNSLPYLKCVLRLSCVVHGPIYGPFMGFYVNGFLSREKTVLWPIYGRFMGFYVNGFLSIPVTAVACVKKDPIGLESIMDTENFEY